MIEDFKINKVSFTYWNVVNLCIFCKLEIWPRDLKADCTLKYCLFGALKLTKIADPDKYSNSGYGIGFSSQLPFLTSNFDFGKTVIIYGAENSSSTHLDNKKNTF